MTLLTLPVWEAIGLIVAGIAVVAVGVNPYRPFVRNILAKIALAMLGLVLIAIGVLFRPW